MQNESLGSTFRLERLKRNMSQEDVSERLNVGTRTLGKIENDKGNHRQSTIKLLADFYSIDIENVSMINKSEK